jgi:L-2-hydroxycarboxylate dehydrogenase (NAD+)
MALVGGLLEGRGVPLSHAKQQALILVEAELKGHPSHGLQRLPRILARIERGLIDPMTMGLSYWRSGAVLEVDGNKGLGPVVALAALDKMRSEATAAGITLAAIHNSNHLGMLGHYVEHIAERGQIGIALSSSEALVHPHGGTRAVLGTNPIAIAVPTARGSLVLDLATSIVSMGKIHHHAANGIPLQPNWAKDASGNPTTDPTLAKSGAIAPFGDAKGYGLGIAIELMVAALAGSALAPTVRGTLDAEAVCNKGDILIAIDMAAAPHLSERLADYLDLVRSSPAIDPERPVLVPGDGARRRREHAALEGFDVDERLWTELNALTTASPVFQQGYMQ